jgi:hypothetical protein
MATLPHRGAYIRYDEALVRFDIPLLQGYCRPNEQFQPRSLLRGAPAELKRLEHTSSTANEAMSTNTSDIWRTTGELAPPVLESWSPYNASFPIW